MKSSSPATIASRRGPSRREENEETQQSEPGMLAVRFILSIAAIPRIARASRRQHEHLSTLRKRGESDGSFEPGNSDRSASHLALSTGAPYIVPRRTPVSCASRRNSLRHKRIS